MDNASQSTPFEADGNDDTGDNSAAITANAPVSTPPFLETWKTSIGMFVFGLVCSFALGYAAEFVSMGSSAGEFEYYTTTGSVTADGRAIVVDFGSEASVPVHLEGAFVDRSDDYAFYEVTGESGLEVLDKAGYYKQCTIGINEGRYILMFLHDYAADQENMMGLLLERK